MMQGGGVGLSDSGAMPGVGRVVGAETVGAGYMLTRSNVADTMPPASASGMRDAQHQIRNYYSVTTGSQFHDMVT